MIADILVGRVNPSGRLPMTFPASEAQLPRARIGGGAGFHRVAPPVTVTYGEGAAVGYRWFAQKGKTPLFPFGFGLAYTTFTLGDLAVVVDGPHAEAAIDVTNTGDRAGAAVPQVYVTGPEGSGVGPRLAGFGRIELAPGETRRVEIAVDPRLIATFDERRRRWRIAPGAYTFSAGFDATRLDASAETELPEGDLPP